MMSAENDAVLEHIQQDKRRIALELEQVRTIDNSLDQDWGVVFPRSGASSWEDLLAAGVEASAVERFRDAHDAVAEALFEEDKAAQARSSAALYDALGHVAVLGPVTSQRRHFIIDGISVAIGLARTLRLERIIDVGCHAGITTSLISRELGCRVLGIDPSAAAIDFARSQARGAAEFTAASIPFGGGERFDFAVVIDSLPEDDAKVGGFLRGLGSILIPGGIAMVVSRYWASARPAKVARQLQAAGLGFGYADVAGGLGGVPPEFGVEDILVLVKGGMRKYPENCRALMESEWGQFRQYANAANTPAREKTQAFERACRKSVCDEWR
jgi:SAM-dependent methyltransferase